MPRKYSVEFKEKAVHQIIEMVRLESCSLQRAYTEVGELLGVSHHTLRAWYRDSASVRDNSDASGGETMEEELRRLRRENRELKRAKVKSWVVVYLFSNLGLVSWRWFRGHLGDKG